MTDRERLYSRRYFDGGLPGGGGYQFYADWPCHEATARHILSRQPSSVLELGCGRGYILKRIHDAGVKGVGLDISRHCQLTAVAENVLRHDVCIAPWPVRPSVDGHGEEDKFDLAFSVAVLELIPEEHVPTVAAELARLSRRGLHGVDFGPGDGKDVSKVNLKPRSWWLERLPPGHEVVDKDDLERGEIPAAYLHGDGKVKLNVGCGPFTMIGHGWINLDVLDFAPHAQSGGYKFQRCDVREGLPYNTGTVDLIASSHMIEHLTYDEGLSFLRECRRVLKPESGAMRVEVPDAGLLTRIYVPCCGPDGCPDGFHDDKWCVMSCYDELSGTCAAALTPAAKLYEILHAHHFSQYDDTTLLLALKLAGFTAMETDFRRSVFGTEAHKQILREGMDFLAPISCFAEAIPLVG